MAKHPVPKRRATSTRGDRRYGTWKTGELKRLTKISETVACKKCGQPRQKHTACVECGDYRGRDVLNREAEVAKKVEKLSAE